MNNNNRGQFYLFTKRRFVPFFITQFLGALNDNLFKNALLVIVVSTAVANADSNTNFLTNLAAGLFILPFFLFSTIAGHLADRFDKAYLIRRIKFAEIIFNAGGLFFIMAGKYNPYVGGAIFIRSTISFFCPIKYAIIPQHVESHELLAANAQVGMGTFVSILLGTLIGGWLVTEPQGQCSWVHSLFWWRLLAGLAAAKYQKHRQKRLTLNTASHLIRSKKPR